MSAVVISFEAVPSPAATGGVNKKGRLLGRLLGALDRFVPPRGAARDPELPAEWFKYPPI